MFLTLFKRCWKHTAYRPAAARSAKLPTHIWRFDDLSNMDNNHTTTDFLAEIADFSAIFSWWFAEDRA
jgi:hypothetical protein